ncbi:PREDICTED: putative ribosome biogenesis protein C8F11.04 isoform X1 [Brassica oleracea var. oleracea]|uniref:Ribosomal protein L1 n=1 Tax=Brassica oleracea var. oleracea TaxID=109376 RepID=A0A0D3BX11_BRAOL|nr:PREDICTED: putative ribosome biogenesis protein C8F11.04 isoform X1 [Brassica oleracea var. oleracea]
MTTTAASPPHPDEQLAPPSQTSRVSPKTVNGAVSALLKWRSEKSKTEKPQLLEQDEFIYLIVTLKKIPQTNRTKPHRIPLPHPLINTEEDSSSPELCLIIDDRPKSGLTKEDAKKKIESDNVPITKILKLSKLRTDYKAFESKRKLCDSYDMFFADRRVISLLPRLIGKKFFSSKKLPAAVDLKHRNWKEQVERACGSAMFFVRTGTCSVVKVGKLSMEGGEIVENVMETLSGVVEVLPGQWKYVRSLHLKLSESVALPVYQSVPDLKLKIDAFGAGNGKSLVFKEEEESGEKSDVVKGKKKKKGRIHEVRYMDSNVSEVLDDDEIGDVEVSNEVVESASDKKKKKRKKVSEVAEAEKPKKKVAKGKLKEKSMDDKEVSEVVETEKPKKKVAKGNVKEKSKDELKPKTKKTEITKQGSGGGLTPKRKKTVVRK